MAPDSSLLRFGGAVGAAALGAAIAAGPATLRIEAATGACGPLGTWALLAAVTLIPMSVAVWALRRAKPGFAALGKPGTLAPLLTLLVWSVATFAALAVLGALFRARTHHRALGGVVFAGAGLVVAVGLGLVTIRLAKVVPRLPRAARWGIGIGLGASLGFLAAVAREQIARHAGPALPPAESARLVDGLAFAFSALLASGSPLVFRRSLALLGPPFAVVTLVLGISALRACPALLGAIEEQAPLFSWLLGLLPQH
jgi:hypothetical protein